MTIHMMLSSNVTINIFILIYVAILYNHITLIYGYSKYNFVGLDNVKSTTIRLFPDEDIKKSLIHLMNVSNINGASIISCVGSVKKINLRLANSNEYLIKEEYYEIVSLVGTLARQVDEFNSTRDGTPYAHLHMSLADRYGNVIGGHVMNGNIVYTTAEITLLIPDNLQFKRVVDKETGYLELEVINTFESNNSTCYEGPV